MNTKQAVEFMNENILDFKDRTDNEEVFDKNECEKFIKKVEEVVLLLQRGGKLEKTWENLKRNFGEDFICPNCSSLDMATPLKNIKNEMDKLEQKYFPKEADSQ